MERLSCHRRQVRKPRSRPSLPSRSSGSLAVELPSLWLRYTSDEILFTDRRLLSANRLPPEISAQQSGPRSAPPIVTKGGECHELADNPRSLVAGAVPTTATTIAITTCITEGEIAAADGAAVCSAGTGTTPSQTASETNNKGQSRCRTRVPTPAGLTRPRRLRR
jgi:hypothetical protein